jgi:hypothetical protein
MKLVMEFKMTYPSYCCPECGEQIGWTGKFFQFIRIPLHQCKKPYKPKIRIDSSGASEWVNIAEFYFSDEGQKFLKETSEFVKRHNKKID